MPDEHEKGIFWKVGIGNDARKLTNCLDTSGKNWHSPFSTTLAPLE